VTLVRKGPVLSVRRRAARGGKGGLPFLYRAPVLGSRAVWQKQGLARREVVALCPSRTHSHKNRGATYAHVEKGGGCGGFLQGPEMSDDPTYHRQPKITATPVPTDFPQLLDDQQWTQAATFAQNDKYSGPSERIGRYYRQRLDELDRPGLEQKRAERTAPASPLRPAIERKGWAAGLPCRPLLAPVDLSDGDGGSSSSNLGASALGILQRQREASEQAAAVPYVGTHRNAHITDPDALQQRVAAYVRDGIDEASLAPYNDAWMESAMEQVPVELNGVSPDEVGELLGEMQEEVHENYFEAVKLSMVEYVLKSNVEGSRLEITQPLAKFEHTSFHPSQDPSVAEAAMPKVRDHDSIRSALLSLSA
jgi:hypothetical protein